MRAMLDTRRSNGTRGEKREAEKRLGVLHTGRSQRRKDLETILTGEAQAAGSSLNAGYSYLITNYFGQDLAMMDNDNNIAMAKRVARLYV